MLRSFCSVQCIYLACSPKKEPGLWTEHPRPGPRSHACSITRANLCLFLPPCSRRTKPQGTQERHGLAGRAPSSSPCHFPCKFYSFEKYWCKWSNEGCSPLPTEQRPQPGLRELRPEQPDRLLNLDTVTKEDERQCPVWVKEGPDAGDRGCLRGGGESRAKGESPRARPTCPKGLRENCLEHLHQAWLKGLTVRGRARGGLMPFWSHLSFQKGASQTNIQTHQK